MLGRASSQYPLTQPIQVEIDHRRREQRQTCDTSRPPTSATPTGARNSEPAPVPKASGSAPKKARRCHHDRAEAQLAGVVDRLARTVSSLRSASSATSTIMIAFFLTMPISRMMPIIEITLRS